MLLNLVKPTCLDPAPAALSCLFLCPGQSYCSPIVIQGSAHYLLCNISTSKLSPMRKVIVHPHTIIVVHQGMSRSYLQKTLKISNPFA